MPGDGPNILRKAVRETHPMGMVSVGVKEREARRAGATTIEDEGTLEEYMVGFRDMARKKWPGMKLIDFGKTSLSNQPAYWFKISAPWADANIEILNVEYHLFYGNTLYFITTSGASADEFHSLQGELRQSVGTFVIEDF